MSLKSPVHLTIHSLTDVNDLARAYALYLEHAGSYLPIPDPDELYEAIAQGQLFGCSTDDNRLAAVGGTFLLGRCRWAGVGRFHDPRSTPGPPVAVYELAGLVVHPEFRGLRPHGLQDILVAVRSLSLALQQTTATCLISSVALGNSGSRKSLLRCGLSEVADVDAPQWLRDVRRTWLTGAHPDVVDYIVRPAALPRLREILRQGLRGLAVKSPQDPAGTVYAIGLAPEIALADVRNYNEQLPAWEDRVPTRRLLGSEPPFVPWPR